MLPQPDPNDSEAGACPQRNFLIMLRYSDTKDTEIETCLCCAHADHIGDGGSEVSNAADPLRLQYLVPLP